MSSWVGVAIGLDAESIDRFPFLSTFGNAGIWQKPGGVLAGFGEWWYEYSARTSYAKLS
jgi:hypothetical protein